MLTIYNAISLVIDSFLHGMYQITIRKQALKVLRKMPLEDAIRLNNKLNDLAEKPYRDDIDVIKLQHRPGFRLRTGNWRVIFERHDKQREINILRIAARGDVYKT